MSGNYSLITSLVTGFGLALPFGYLFEKFLRTPALVGYICAGLAVSFFPGLPPVDPNVLSQLAEIGVMLLMFGVGLHFSVKNLLAVKTLAIPGAIAQMSIAMVLGALFASAVWDWNFGQSVMFGLTISCASTVVCTKALEIRGLTMTMRGQAAVGWLVVQDLVSVLFLVLLPPFAQMIQGTGTVSGAQVMIDVVKTLAGVALFVFLMVAAGRKLLPWMLKLVASTGSRELFTLAVLGSAIVIAYGAGALFQVSFALGAFFAGMVMQESRYAHRAAKNSLPLQDAFSVLFFVSVGLMLDWRIFIDRPLEVLAVVAIIMGATTTVSAALAVLLRWPLDVALTLGASLGQIGEFSYILAQQGMALKLADGNMLSLIVAASILTIALNPILFAAIGRIRHRLVVRYAWARRAAMRQTPGESLANSTGVEFLSGQVVVAGMSEITTELFRVLKRMERRTTVVCEPSDAERLRETEKDTAFMRVLAGDPADPSTLVGAHVVTAGVVVAVEPDPVRLVKIYNAVRAVNPKVPFVARVRHLEEGAGLRADDPNLHVVSETLLTSLALSSEALKTILKNPTKPADRNEEDEDEEAVERAQRPEEKLRRLFEDEYRRSVEAVRGPTKLAQTADAAAQGPTDAAAKDSLEAQLPEASGAQSDFGAKAAHWAAEAGSLIGRLRARFSGGKGI